jgi:hypothetical protein
MLIPCSRACLSAESFSPLPLSANSTTLSEVAKVNWRGREVFRSSSRIGEDAVEGIAGFYFLILSLSSCRRTFNLSSPFPLSIVASISESIGTITNGIG